MTLNNNIKNGIERFNSLLHPLNLNIVLATITIKPISRSIIGSFGISGRKDETNFRNQFQEA
jgi:hypothetical protein